MTIRPQVIGAVQMSVAFESHSLLSHCRFVKQACFRTTHKGIYAPLVSALNGVYCFCVSPLNTGIHPPPVSPPAFCLDYGLMGDS